MGVHGLWQLLNSTGKPVSLDSLEGKVLAVDVSVWLHQLSKGMRDSDGNPLPHAHLHGLFTRICKLLYYRIKPVFVFDGGVPVLKKQTLAVRREKRDDAEKESTRLQQKLLTNLIRSQAVKEALGLDKAPKLPSVPKKPSRDAVFELPPLPESSERYLKENKDLDESFEERRELQQLIEDQYEDLNAIDVESEDFRCLPPDIQHEIIMDMKERRKNYKMSRRMELPEDSRDFSKFQVAKLLKHSKLTVRLDDLRKELNSKTDELSKHLGDSLYSKEVLTQRVISSDASHSVLIKGLRDKRKKSSEEKETKAFPTVSEESSNSDELMLDSGSEERANIDFRNPDQLAVIGKAIIGQSRSAARRIPGKELSGYLGDQGISGQDSNSCDGRISNVNGDTCSNINGKPVYRPLIEIDSDSESSDEDSDYTSEPVQNPNQSRDHTYEPDQSTSTYTSKPVQNIRSSDLVRGELNNDVMSLIPKTVNENSDNEVIIVDDSDLMDDIQANRDLQLAIEKSIQDQIRLVANSSESADLPKKATECKAGPDKSKSIFIKQMSNKSAFSEDLSNSAEQSEHLEIEKENFPANKNVDTTAVKIFRKQVSCMSNFSDESDKVPVNDSVKKKKKDELNEVPPKRRASDLSDNAPEPKRKKMEKSSQGDSGNIGSVSSTLSGDESSESEDGFLEVKVDTANLEEDDLFPASMFEPTPLDSNHGDDSVVTMETCGKQPVKSSGIDLKLNQNGEMEASEVVVLDEDSSGSNKKLHDQKIEGKVEDAVISTSGSNKKLHDQKIEGKVEDVVISKNDTANLNELENEKKDIEPENQAEMDNDEVFDGVHDNAEMREVPDVIETRGSGSSVSSLPDVVETIHTQERILSPESPRAVPDLVKNYQNLDFQTLAGMRENLAAESQALQQERGRQERLATSINDQMHAEAQEMLRLFGIPYIVSPTEAEAQCAQLDILKLTQGTITDDSDIWLFGGTNVYRNFFNQQKHVEFYRSDSISSHLGLTREKLINLALLCGSDYTEGIQGVGPVTAMEILIEFPGEGLEGLLALKSWWDSAQKQYIKPKESKLKAKIRELDLSPGFPSMQVVEAYMSPTVDDSAEPFSWGTPDTDGLKHFIGIKLGWASEKVDEHLQPVLKRLKDRQSQRRISSFFQPENYIEPAKMKSKRLQKVVNRFLNPTDSQEDSEDTKSNGASGTSKSKKGRRTVKGQSETQSAENTNEKDDNVDEKNIDENVNKSTRGRGRARGRGQGQRGRGQKGQKSRVSKAMEVTEKFVSESISSESDSEDSISELKSIDSDDEIPVIESSLDISEILGMSGFGDLNSENTEQMDVNEDESEMEKMLDSDEDLSDSELFRNEGGFIREEEDGKSLKPVKPQRSEIMQGVLKQVEEAKSKYFESESSQEEDRAADSRSKYFEEESQDSVVLEFKGTDNNAKLKDHKKCNSEQGTISEEDKRKTRFDVNTTAADNAIADSYETDKVESKLLATDTKDPVTSLTQRKVDYSKKVKSILKETKDKDKQGNLGVEIKKEPDAYFDGTGDSTNVERKIDKKSAAISQSGNVSKVQPVQSTEAAANRDNEKDAECGDHKAEVKIKQEAGDSYVANPIKQLATGVPWASKKGKAKGVKGKARVKGRKMEPVEKIVRKSTRSVKGSKRVAGTVNLSESDSDSSD